ncbi:MAG: LptA/OstA family protein [Fimbriimonadales bacterium]|nr:LptA/OstA family protein [Fimbriimonadales bacterium]
MRWLCVGWLLISWSLQVQSQGGQGIRFGEVRITGYDAIKGVRRYKDDRYEVELLSKPGRLTRLEAPEQYLTLTCQNLKATLGPDPQKRPAVLSAEATGQVTFRYDRPRPLSRLNGTARRVLYDGQKQTVTLEGDVSLDGEDESYIVRFRENERIVVYLEEDLQRVEAKSKERDGIPIGEMTIRLKQQQP